MKAVSMITLPEPEFNDWLTGEDGPSILQAQNWR